MKQFSSLRLITMTGMLLVGLLGMASPALSQQCTLTEADAPGFPAGGTLAITATLGSGTVTVQAGGNGLNSPLQLNSSSNATVTLPSFSTGTTSPVQVAFTIDNATLASSFSFTAATPFHAVIVTVSCTAAPPPPSACVLTQGYWKNHPTEWPVTTLTLGNVSYTQAQLLSILSQPVKGNGLVSLVHQLIAAKLNIADGAIAPATVQQAIAAADQLIGNSIVPPVGNGSVSTSSTSGLIDILDTFNNGNTPGGPAHCPD